MFQRILEQMRKKIREKEYVMTLHAEEEMNDDNLTIYNIEKGILNGEILERQRDKLTEEWKYRIRGSSQGSNLEIIDKISVTDKLVIITVYVANKEINK